MDEAAVRPDDGVKYYTYILLYVDDCFCIHHDVVVALQAFNKYFQMMPGSIWDPDIYLGANSRKVVWTMVSVPGLQTQASIFRMMLPKVEQYLALHYQERRLNFWSMAKWICFRMDETPELDDELAKYPVSR